jgi:DnaJ domain
MYMHFYFFLLSIICTPIKRREALQRWRVEMSKGVEDSAVDEAKNVLGFQGKQVTYADLRKSYKNLARKYHPDKNPNGRQMFEKIRIAYDLLSSVDMKVTETDMRNVALLITAQNIIYRRFPEAVNDQKYPAYVHLLDVLSVPPTPSFSSPSSSAAADDESGKDVYIDPLIGTPSDLLLAGTTLIYYTCSVSPLNAREFVKVGGTKRLYEIVCYAVSTITTQPPLPSPLLSPAIKRARDLLFYSMKAFTAIVSFDIGRSSVLELCPEFAEEMGVILSLDKVVPIAVENCLETISRCCEMSALQSAFECAGLVWKLVPMLLAYDGTLQEDYADESLRLTPCQNSSNMHAVLSAKALGRLAGVMFHDLASPLNPPLVDCLNLLLTQPIAKLLRNRRPWDLLSALNRNVEGTTMIWNLNMRRELLEFVLQVDCDRTPGSRHGDLGPASTFKFSALEGELCVCGVYLRIFNKTALTVDIDDPSLFAKELLDYIRNALLTLDHHSEEKEESMGSYDAMDNSMEEDSCFYDCSTGVNEWGLDPAKSKHCGLQLSVEALRTIADVHSYVAFDIASHTDGPDTVFFLLELPSDCSVFLAATQLLTTLGRSADFVSIALKSAETDVITGQETGAGAGGGRMKQPSVLWRLLRAVCTIVGPGSPFLWSAAEGYSSHADGLRCLLDTGDWTAYTLLSKFLSLSLSLSLSFFFSLSLSFSLFLYYFISYALSLPPPSIPLPPSRWRRAHAWCTSQCPWIHQ